MKVIKKYYIKTYICIYLPTFIYILDESELLLPYNLKKINENLNKIKRKYALK